MLNKKIYTIAFSDFCESTRYQHYIWEGDEPEPSDEEFMEAVKASFREQNKNKNADVWKKAYIRYVKGGDYLDVGFKNPERNYFDLYKLMRKRKFRELDLNPIKTLEDNICYSHDLVFKDKTEIAEYFGENWLKAVEEVENSVTLLEFHHVSGVNYYLAPCDLATYKRRVFDHHKSQDEKSIKLLLATLNMSEDDENRFLDDWNYDPATRCYVLGCEEVPYFDLRIKSNIVLDLDENYFPKDKKIFLELLGETWYNEYMEYLANKEKNNNDN